MVLFPAEVAGNVKRQVQHRLFTNSTGNCNKDQLLEQLKLQSL